jgi:signal transduction histidine kinase
MRAGDAQPNTASSWASEEALWRAICDSAKLPPQAPMAWPRQGWMLNFLHPALERAYGQAEYLRNRWFITVACSLMALVVACFFALDPILAPAYGLDTIAASRAWVGLPSLVLLVVGVRLIKQAERWYPWCAACTSVYMLQVAALLWQLGEPSFQYLSYGVWQGLIGVFFLSGLPLRWAAPTGAFCCLAYGAVALAIRVDVEAFVTYFAVDAFIVFTFCAIAVFRYERASRRQFVAQARANIAYDQQLLAQADRRRWLEIFAGFLGHELKNAMARVSSSIEMASLTSQDTRARTYFERAQHSLAFMRRLLTQAADATSLEVALARSDHARVDLSSLVAERLDDHQQDSTGPRFEVRVEPGIEVYGNEDALLQLLEKLINNAIEHGSPGLPIQVHLQAREGWCQLTVQDLGDALPPDTERLFEPFCSIKPRQATAADSNLGLGLFVARTIARYHGGTLKAQPLQDPATGMAGAAFTAELPLRGAEPSQVVGTHR